MNILIAGGTGLIGQELIRGMGHEHNFTLVSRNKEVLQNRAGQAAKLITWNELDSLDAGQFDAVINLCGSNIAAHRWTKAIKEELIYSRVHTTKTLVSWIIKYKAKPHFYCANAIGIYGVQNNGDEHSFNEQSPIDFNKPKDFLSEIGIHWQLALKEAIDAGIAVTTTRFGVVLKKGQGFLAKLYPSFICGLGSVIGDGRQYLSWVDSEDVVNAYQFLLNHPNITGAVNITSPNPCMQKEFAKVFAQLLHRPLFLRTPAWVIKLLLGEMGDYLINRGQKVVPQRLLAEGFVFKWPDIQSALQHCMTKKD